MSKQRGFSLYVMGFWIFLASFFGLLAVKFAPIYVDHFYLNGFFEEVSEESMTESFGRRVFLDRIEARMKVNNVTGIDVADVVDFRGDEIILQYQVQTHVFHNIEALVTFSETYNWNPN